jgi:hypothetical protein
VTRLVVLLVTVAATAAACGASTGLQSRRAAEARGNTISGYGISIDLPSGWSGRIFKRDTRTAVALRAANSPVYLGASVFPGAAGAEMPADGVLIELSDPEIPLPNSSFPTTTLPIDIRRSDFGRFKGVTTPGYALRHVALNGRSVMVGVGFGSADPSDALLAEANRVLTSLHVEPDRSAWGGEDAYGQVPRVSFAAPGDWFTAETSLLVPGDRPIPVAWAGNVPFVDDPGVSEFPDSTVRKLPPNGVVIETVGPRPYSGSADFPRLSLPLKLSDGYFHGDGYEGQPAPNVSVYFIDARIGDEVLNASIWFGRNEPTPAMLAEANSALATLSIAR